MTSTGYFETRRRLESELAAAVRAVAEAAAAAAASDAAVNVAREELALGRISRGELLKIQKANGRQIEELANKQAAVRAVQRLAVEAREEADRQERREAAQRAAEAKAAYDALERRIGPWLDRVIAELGEFDSELARLARDTPVNRLPSGTAPHHELTLALHRMRGVFPNSGR